MLSSAALSASIDTRSYVELPEVLMLNETYVLGGDPFPGVYMRDIPALLESGYRMSRPKYVNSEL